jgi:DNA anti-recombination protein RmuC
MIQRSDEEFIAAVSRMLDRSLEQLDPAIQQRLDSARQQAQSQDSLADSLPHAAHQSLDRQSEISPEVEARLDQIRQRALDRMPRPAENRQRRSLVEMISEGLQLRAWQLSAGMLATSFVLVTAISLLPYGNNTELSLDQELALLATEDDIELYENLDFYLWLAENEFESL